MAATTPKNRRPSSSVTLCTAPSPRDGLVYVCDRANDRIQVFKKDGTFVKEKFIAPKTLGDSSVWDIAFSPDPEQTLSSLPMARTSGSTSWIGKASRF